MSNEGTKKLRPDSTRKNKEVFLIAVRFNDFGNHCYYIRSCVMLVSCYAVRTRQTYI